MPDYATMLKLFSRFCIMNVEYCTVFSFADVIPIVTSERNMSITFKAERAQLMEAAAHPIT